MTFFLLRKMPVNCPICNGPLINDYQNIARGRTRLTKKCCKQVTHQITIRACDRDNDYIDWVSIPWGHTDVINWYYGSGRLLLNTIKGQDYHIPWFEPDFSDLKKLKEKLKTYLLFS